MINDLDTGYIPQGDTGTTTMTRPLTQEQLQGELGSGEWSRYAFTEPGEIVVKHFVDSLTLLRAFTPPVGATLVDVGTGAGFPSVPVKIVRPDLRVTLLDSLNKRLVFLRELSGALGQEENVCVHARAEEAGRQPGHREQYALATARAVAHLRS